MGFKVGDRVRLVDNSAGFAVPVGSIGTVGRLGDECDRNLHVVWVRWVGRPLALWHYLHEITLALVETPVDVSAPSVEDELAALYRRARASWNSTVRLCHPGCSADLFHMGFRGKVATSADGQFSRRSLLIADLLVDAHTTGDVLTILSEFRLI